MTRETGLYPSAIQTARRWIELWRGPKRSLIETSTANPYLLEVENFCAAVAGERAPDISAAETLRNLGVMDELAAAARLPNYQLEAKGSSP